MNHVFSYKSPIGKLWIADNTESIVQISTAPIEGYVKETSLIKQCYQELCEYFKQDREQFNFPISFKDTPFREKCYKALLNIPYGSTCTYKDLAIAIGNPKACRAVGQAIHHNPLLIVIPCHRIIQTNGSLGGFGAGTEIKMKLLNIENNKDVIR